VTGVDVRVDRVGRGEPIVFLNGLLGLNEHWFACMSCLAGPRSAAKPLDLECLFIEAPLLEMRGSGCSVQGVTQLTIGLLETLLDKPAILVGNSLGGHVALRIALARPDLARGIALVGSSGLFERTFDTDWQHSPSREWLTRKIGELFHDPARMAPGMVELAYQELSRRSAARALVKLGRSAKRDHLGRELPNVRQPVLLAWGKQDTVTPPEVAREFHDNLPASRLRWIDQCGHAPQIERPDELSELLGGFAKDVFTGAFAPEDQHGRPLPGAQSSSPGVA
jgi:pimeloyl-ACP methyl ester carboxylesterase